MPCHSKDTDKKDALRVSDYYGFEMINLDLTNTYDSFKEQINNLGTFTEEELKNSNINLKPRLRMSALYYVSAMLSSKYKKCILS